MVKNKVESTPAKLNRPKHTQEIRRLGVIGEYALQVIVAQTLAQHFVQDGSPVDGHVKIARSIELAAVYATAHS